MILPQIDVRLLVAIEVRALVEVVLCAFQKPDVRVESTVDGQVCGAAGTHVPFPEEVRGEVGLLESFCATVVMRRSAPLALERLLHSLF